MQHSRPLAVVTPKTARKSRGHWARLLKKLAKSYNVGKETISRLAG